MYFKLIYHGGPAGTGSTKNRDGKHVLQKVYGGKMKDVAQNKHDKKGFLKIYGGMKRTDLHTNKYGKHLNLMIHGKKKDITKNKYG